MRHRVFGCAEPGVASLWRRANVLSLHGAARYPCVHWAGGAAIFMLIGHKKCDMSLMGTSHNGRA